jgi:hypothetical protein
MAKTYTQILTQSNLGICKLFYNSNIFSFFFYNPIVFWLFGFAMLDTCMYYWPPKKKITNFANNFMSITHAYFY